MSEVMDDVVPMRPPAPTKPAVLAYRRALEMSLDALKAGSAEIALASARSGGDIAARDALTELFLKIRVAEFEIECNHSAFELAERQDAAAQVAWRAAIQMLPPDEIIAGIGKDSCCGRCTPGVPGGCVLTASVPHAGATCSHPVKVKHLFHRDAHGLLQFPDRDNPQASRVFDAACEKLNVRGEFS